MDNNATIELLDEDGNAASEICLSPSWSEFTGNKKKKEKKRSNKEKKESDKKHKRNLEQLKAAEMKAGNRLSKKPPPAAMDTQRMPAALRRHSGTSIMSSLSSRENSRRTSKEEKRLSIASSMNGVSRATSNTNIEPSLESPGSFRSLVNSMAPQLPKLRGFSWHSRHSSAVGVGRRGSSGSETAYEKNIIDFAYRLDAPSIQLDLKTSPMSLVENQSASNNTAQTSQKPMPSVPRSKTAPELGIFQGEQVEGTGVQHDALPKCQLIANAAESREYFGSGTRPVPSPSVGQAADGTTKMAANNGIMSDEYIQISRKHTSTGGYGVQPSQFKSRKDGSSYVHKQRMYQQQRSIAGFQDELALKDANTSPIEDALTTADGHLVHPHQTVSSEPPKLPVRQSVADNSYKAKPEQLQKDQPGRSHALLSGLRQTIAFNQTLASAVTKSDATIGFRRFHKKPKQPNSSLPAKPADAKISAAPVGVQQSSKAVPDLSGTLANQDSGQPARTLELDSCIQSGNSSERLKQSSHSRTRTCSSDLLNETLSGKPLQELKTTQSLSATPQDELLIPPLASVEEINPQPREMTEADNTNRSTTPDSPEVPIKVKTPNKKSAEVIIEGVTGEGVVRKTSIKRPRSNPTLHTTVSAQSGLLSFDFLPKLKHQPLSKPKRTSLVQSGLLSTHEASPLSMVSAIPPPKPQMTKSSSEPLLPTPAFAPDLKLMPRSPLRPSLHLLQSEASALRPGLANSRRRTMSPAGQFNRSSAMGPLSFAKGGIAEGLDAKPIAKMFVICCKCKFWHDLPSKLYELMASPQKLRQEDGSDNAKGKAKEATVDTAVKCPWCEHYMTTWCCPGWTTVVYLHERHH